MQTRCKANWSCLLPIRIAESHKIIIKYIHYSKKRRSFRFHRQLYSTAGLVYKYFAQSLNFNLDLPQTRRQHFLPRPVTWLSESRLERRSELLNLEWVLLPLAKTFSASSSSLLYSPQHALGFHRLANDIWFTMSASSWVIPEKGVPLTSIIVSPGRRPARSAMDPSSMREIYTPMPEDSRDVTLKLENNSSSPPYQSHVRL